MSKKKVDLTTVWLCRSRARERFGAEAGELAGSRTRSGARCFPGCGALSSQGREQTPVRHGPSSASQTRKSSTSNWQEFRLGEQTTCNTYLRQFFSSTKSQTWVHLRNVSDFWHLFIFQWVKIRLSDFAEKFCLDSAKFAAGVNGIVTLDNLSKMNCAGCTNSLALTCKLWSVLHWARGPKNRKPHATHVTCSICRLLVFHVYLYLHSLKALKMVMWMTTISTPNPVFHGRAFSVISPVWNQ